MKKVGRQRWVAPFGIVRQVSDLSLRQAVSLDGIMQGIERGMVREMADQRGRTHNRAVALRPVAPATLHESRDEMRQYTLFGLRQLWLVAFIGRRNRR